MYPDEIVKQVNELGRIVCPFCGGGRTKEKSMMVWGPGQYKCFRAQCGRWRSVRLPGQKGHTPTPMVYTRPTEALTAGQIASFTLRFGMTPPEGMNYNKETDRFVQPVYGPMNELRGHLARSLSGGKPKTITYRIAVDQPFIHWPFKYAGITYIVEDWVSAERLRQHRFCAVALLGTHIGIDIAQEIAHNQDGRVIICLDQDATNKAIQHVFNWGHIIEDLEAYPLKKDIKDMNKVELQEFLNATSTKGIGRNNGEQGSL